MKQNQATQTTIDKLVKFVNQRPGLDFSNYGDHKIYNSESREITKDRQDFFELFALASRRVDNLNEQLTKYLTETSDRLRINEKGQIEYCTGQYFPTEYRPAANRVLRSIIWDSYRDETIYIPEDDKIGYVGTPVYKDGHEIRKAIRRNLSRRVGKLYFN
jgi:hypothetical protein